MQVQTIEYQDQALTLEGFYAFDAKIGHANKRPVILVCHDWSGCNDFAREQTQKLAALGYLGFAIDMFGKGKYGNTKEEKTALIMPLMQNRALLRQRIQSGFATAKTLAMADSSKMAAIGFCFGGLCALDLARSGADLRGVVSFHGLLNAPEALPAHLIKAKVLALHGYDDPMVSPEVVNSFAQEMTQAQVDWQVHLYGNTMHAFTNPKANDPGFGTVYNAQAEKRSWEAMKDFLAEVL